MSALRDLGLDVAGRAARDRAQSQKNRQLLADIARERELQKLARHAHCSRAEAEQRRAAGQRFCTLHKWFQGSVCTACRDARTRADRARKGLEP